MKEIILSGFNINSIFLNMKTFSGTKFFLNRLYDTYCILQIWKSVIRTNYLIYTRIVFFLQFYSMPYQFCCNVNVYFSIMVIHIPSCVNPIRVIVYFHVVCFVCFFFIISCTPYFDFSYVNNFFLKLQDLQCAIHDNSSNK